MENLNIPMKDDFMAGLEFHTNKQPASERKLRGGFYTPRNLAEYLVNWGIRGNTRTILEPSCGDGNFVVAALTRLKEQSNPKNSVHIVAVELEKEEIDKAKSRAKNEKLEAAQLEWLNQDFFAAYSNLSEKRRFDLIIGNPPFIRFQYFEEGSRKRAFEHLRLAGYHPTKLDNAWVAFVELSIELLSTGGRLAMVVPAELLQVNYAKDLRYRLSTQFQNLLLIGFRKLAFPEIQQEVFLLLADGKTEVGNQASDIHTVECKDVSQLCSTGNLGAAAVHGPGRHSRNGMKWTAMFVGESAFAALDEAEKANGLTRLGKLAAVDVGIVTGRNSYFIVTENRKDELQASDLVVPIIGRTCALKATEFTADDFCRYKKEYPCFLLNFNKRKFDELPKSLADYIQFGEKKKIHEGYKCRIRKRWYDVPSIYTPDLFLFRQIHLYPLLVVNRSGATSTDTIHRVRLRSGIDPDILASVSFNSLTLAWAEVCGRSYGGGVPELEPREAEELRSRTTRKLRSMLQRSRVF